MRGRELLKKQGGIDAGGTGLCSPLFDARLCSVNVGAALCSLPEDPLVMLAAPSFAHLNRLHFLVLNLST